MHHKLECLDGIDAVRGPDLPVAEADDAVRAEVVILAACLARCANLDRGGDARFLADSRRRTAMTLPMAIPTTLGGVLFRRVGERRPGVL